MGTGFFKPNISSMVGALYKDGDPGRDAGFSLFYSGINVGALLGAGMSSPDPQASAMDKLMLYTAGYQQFAVYAVVAGGLLIILSPLVRKLMGEVK